MFINQTHYQIELENQSGKKEILEPNLDSLVLEFEKVPSNFYGNVSSCVGPFCQITDPPDVYKTNDAVNIHLSREIEESKLGTKHIVYFDVALFMFQKYQRTDFLTFPYNDFIEKVNFRDLISMEFAFKPVRELYQPKLT